MKNLNLIIAAILLLQACGRHDSEDSSRSSASETKIVSIALNTKADLPACTESIKNQLAYVKSEGQFYACVSDWEVIAIKGEKGAAGATGSVGQTGAVMTNTMWLDTQTGLTWSIGQNMTFDTALAGCVGGYRQPSSTELLAAVQHGLGTASGLISGPTAAWSSTVYSATYGWYVNLTGTPALQTDLKTTAKGLFCLK